MLNDISSLPWLAGSTLTIWLLKLHNIYSEASVHMYTFSEEEVDVVLFGKYFESANGFG